MRSYYTLCAHIRVPSLPLKKDRYKPERNGSPNVPFTLLRAFVKPPERRQHVADLVDLLRAVDAGPDQLISFHRNISLNLFKRLIVSLIPPNVSHVHRMIRNKRLMQQLGISRLVTKHAAVRIQRFIPPGHTVILFPFRPFSMLIAGLHWRRLVRA
jgi:hypothetical protein